MGHLLGREDQVLAELLDDQVEVVVTDRRAVDSDHPAHHVHPLFRGLACLLDHLDPSLRVQPVADRAFPAGG